MARKRTLHTGLTLAYAEVYRTLLENAEPFLVDNKELRVSLVRRGRTHGLACYRGDKGFRVTIGTKNIIVKEDSAEFFGVGKKKRPNPDVQQVCEAIKAIVHGLPFEVGARVRVKSLSPDAEDEDMYVASYGHLPPKVGATGVVIAYTDLPLVAVHLDDPLMSDDGVTESILFSVLFDQEELELCST